MYLTRLSPIVTTARETPPPPPRPTVRDAALDGVTGGKRSDGDCTFSQTRNGGTRTTAFVEVVVVVIFVDGPLPFLFRCDRDLNSSRAWRLDIHRLCLSRRVPDSRATLPFRRRRRRRRDDISADCFTLLP